MDSKLESTAACSTPAVTTCPVGALWCWQSGWAPRDSSGNATSMPGFPLARGSAWAGGRVHTPSRETSRGGAPPAVERRLHLHHTPSRVTPAVGHHQLSRGGSTYPLHRHRGLRHRRCRRELRLRQHKLLLAFRRRQRPRWHSDLAAADERAHERPAVGLERRLNSLASGHLPPHL